MKIPHIQDIRPGLLVLVVLLVLVPGREGRRKRDRERSSRGLVPQLMDNYTAPSLPPAGEVGCNAALLSCVYRGGCGLALQQYQLSCSSLVQGITTSCSKDCQFALIALLSTPEGERLMQCQCEDPSCRLQKARVEPCRAQVTWNTDPGSLVSCTAATWICLADPLCSTALDYYNRNCQAMFKGRKCSRRCKNSLDILLRQKSAAKLATCWCEGSEDYDCSQIRRNTDVLCFGRKVVVEVEENSVEVEIQRKTSGAEGGRRNFFIVLFSFFASCLVSELGASLTSLIKSLQTFSS